MFVKVGSVWEEKDNILPRDLKSAAVHLNSVCALIIHAVMEMESQIYMNKCRRRNETRFLLTN